MIKVYVDSIRRSIKSNQQVVLLKEEGGDRFLPIWIDKIQGDALLLALKNPSPEIAVQAQDLVQTLTTLGDLRIEKLVISDLQDDIYWAELVVRKANRIFSSSHEIKCYPSAGLNLAVRTNSPIFITPEVMEKASIRPDNAKETSKTDDLAIFYRDKNVYIRLADENDAEVIHALSLEAQQMHAEALPHIFKISESSSFSVADVADLLADTDNYFFIGHENDQPIGYIHVQAVNQAETSSQYARNYIYIYNIIIETSHRRKGHGKQLLETVRSLAKAKDIDTIELDVWLFNDDARTFFAKQGFISTLERLSMDVETGKEINNQ